MKTVNDLPVYEGNDPSALDEYSAMMAEAILKLIEKNKYNDEELKQENEKLKNNLINVKTEQSSNINIKDCSDFEGSIDVEGNSVQESRKGYNLLNVPEILEISIFKEIEVNLKANKNYTFKFDNAIAGADNNISTIVFRNTTDVVTKKLNTSTIKKFEIQPTQDITNIRIYASTDYSSSVGKTKTFQKLMIYEGTEDKEYEQYGVSPSPEYPSEIQNVEGNIDITVCNKNTFNSKKIPNGSIITVNDDQSITLKNNTNASGYVNTGIKLKDICKGLKSGNTTFLKIITTFENKYIYLAGINQLWNDETSKILTEEMLESTVVLYGGYQKIDILKIQISLNKLEEYVEHQSQTITFPLQEGQKLMLGDYLADDGIRHKRKQFEVDGTNLKVNGVSKYTNGLYYCKVTVPFTSIDFSDGYSTHFKWVKSGIAIGNCYVTGAGKGLIFILEDQSITTVEGANNWLIQQKQAGTPVKFECELAEEEIEPYTPEQQEAYNKLQKVLPYKLTTNIFTDLALLKFNYIADTKTYIDNKTTNIQNQLNIINELLSTTSTSALLLDNMQTDLESEVI